MQKKHHLLLVFSQAPLASARHEEIWSMVTVNVPCEINDISDYDTSYNMQVGEQPV
jgi:hypothetical protein